MEVEMIKPDDREVFNVMTERGFTEAFGLNEIDLMVRLGLIKWEKTTSFGEGKSVHFYVRA